MFVVSKSTRETSDWIFITDNFVLVIRSTLLYTVQKVDPSLVIQFVFCRAGFFWNLFQVKFLENQTEPKMETWRRLDQWFVIYVNFTRLCTIGYFQPNDSWSFPLFLRWCLDRSKTREGVQVASQCFLPNTNGSSFLTCFFFVRIYA